ncbi:rCG29495 [Rattus norvegicus]|uniref:RCG29495 n=1 Tax=Rattus norvegicus TaxID=10116 RepID=A6K965_RAT|nr:rCG29495 [Rattus norvegicus]
MAALLSHKLTEGKEGFCYQCVKVSFRIDLKQKQKQKTHEIAAVEENLLKDDMEARQWWCMLLVPILGRQRQENPCEFKPGLQREF